MNMKKLALAALVAMTFAGCSSNAETEVKKDEKQVEEDANKVENDVKDEAKDTEEGIKDDAAKVESDVKEDTAKFDNAAAKAKEDLRKELKVDDGDTVKEAEITEDSGDKIIAYVSEKDGQIKDIKIDEIKTDGTSKRAAGEDYGMKAASTIQKEWVDQADFLEKYMIEHGVDSITVDEEGKTDQEDVLSGATMTPKYFVEVVKKAMESK